MRGDDLEVGERRGGGVEPDRPRKVDSDALPAGLAGSDAARPGVEQHDQSELLAFLVQGPVLLLVRRESLERGMQLHALQSKVCDAIQLRHRAVALQWIDAAEAGEGAGRSRGSRWGRPCSCATWWNGSLQRSRRWWSLSASLSRWSSSCRTAWSSTASGRRDRLPVSRRACWRRATRCCSPSPAICLTSHRRER